MKLKLHDGVVMKYLRKTMQIMRLSVYFILISITLAFSPTSYSQKTKLTLDLNSATVKDVIKVIENQSEFIFSYHEKLLDLNRKVTLHTAEQDVETILNQLFAETQNIYIIDDRHIVIGIAPRKDLEKQMLRLKENVKPVMEQPRQKEISGKVTDTNGMPVLGATVFVKGTTIGTITNSEGAFSLSIPLNAEILQFSFVGMRMQEVPIAERTIFAIVLEEDVIGLEEVVFVGYGSQQKATITGAISSMGTEQLLQSPVANLSNAMVGRLSGLLTTQISGAPGFEDNTLRIRGSGTFTGLTSPLVMVDGIEAENYNNLDPNEVENITILKDASATAVYGVRGANGVVLITTRRGTIGKPKVSITAQTSMAKVAEERSFLGSPEWAQGHTEAAMYDSYVTGSFNPKYTAEDVQKYRDQSDPLFYPDKNWVSELLKPMAPQSQYNFNISGGQNNVRYFISLGHLNQGGLINGNYYDTGYDNDISYKRYNFRSNFDFDVTKRLTIKVNFSSQFEQFKGNPQPTSSVTSAFGYYLSRLYFAPPNVSPGLWDGKVVDLVTQIGQYQNPVAEFFLHPFERSKNNFLTGTLRFDYDLDFIMKGLTIHGSTTNQNRNSASETITKTLVEYLAFPIDGGYGLGPQNDDGPFSFSESTSYRRREDYEAGLNYLGKAGNHSYTGLLLYNQSKEYPGPSLSIPRGYQGLVGRVTYDFRKRYMAEFNVGYNGTENFAIGRRFGFFPAYSLGWVMSDEPFFPTNNFINYIKVRASYGEVGNDKIGGQRFLYNPSSFLYGSLDQRHSRLFNYAFGVEGVDVVTYTGAGEGVLGNPFVTWERSKKLDIGIDLVILKEMRVSIDYFNENRDNILANPGTVPTLVGINFPAYNFGKMNNHGIDGEASYNGRAGRINYFAKFVFTITDNEVVFRDEPIRPYGYLQTTGQRNDQYYGLLEQGYYNAWDEVIDAYRPTSSYSSNRIQPGDFKYKDINGDGIIDSNDMIPIGYAPFPGNSFGLSVGGGFMGFDLSILFQAASGYSHSATKSFRTGWDADNGSTQSFVYNDAWTYERYLAGEQIAMPRLGKTGGSHNLINNTKWIQNSSYLRLKNMEIGYSLPNALLSKIGLGSARIFFNGQNLLTFSRLLPGIDPETPTYNDSNHEPYPLMKVYNGGINIKF